MREHQPNIRALRLEPLCKDSARLRGSVPLSALGRLAEGFSAATDGAVQWELTCSTRTVAGAEAQMWVYLGAQATVPLQCQRCLGLLSQRMEVGRAIRFVRGEEWAERLDEESEDDVLALPAALDLQTLLEDELILALPIVPRHHGPCPQPLWAESPAQAPEAPPDDPEPHPFAALAALKGRGRST